MKNLLAILLAFVVMAIPCLSVAADQAAKSRIPRGYLHTICDAELSTGICDNNLTNDRYAIVDKYDSITFFLTEVGAANSVCEIYAVDESIDITGADLSSLQANKINSTSLTGAQDKLSYSSINYYAVWIDCTTIGGTSTTVTMQGSVGRYRR